MTIKERAKEWSQHYIGKSRQGITYCSYEMGACVQKNIDENKVEEILYNALEIGDITCKDIEKLISTIKDAFNE